MNSKLVSGERILLTLWVGGMWAIGYVAAPMLFSVLEDARLAGTLAGEMFKAMSFIGLVCGGLLLVSAWWRVTGKWYREWRIGVLLTMLALTGVGQFILQPEMAALRASGLVPDSAEAVRFGALHGIAATVYLITSLLGMVLVIFAPAGEGRPE